MATEAKLGTPLPQLHNNLANASSQMVQTMLIPITISLGSTSESLPPQLAKLGNDELVLIELQGSLDVESSLNSDRDGQMVGKFRLDEGSVRTELFELFDVRQY